MTSTERGQAPFLVPDERTPLIAASSLGDANGQAVANGDAQRQDEDKPLPLGQILLLCYGRLVEPISYFSIFPFVNQMIFETGEVEQAQVGFYSGLIESLFSLTQMLLMIWYGRAADTFGRKPVLVFSFCGGALATAMYGFAKTIWQMILFRCIAGLFGGSVVTIRVMVSENSTPKTQARAFSYFAIFSNVGILLGPIIGGGLSKPAESFPFLFGNIQLFKDYPYALPTLVSGAFGASAALVGFLFVNETLQSKKAGQKAVKPMPIFDILKCPGVPVVLGIFATTSLLGLSFTAVVPVFWFTDVDLGGFGFSPRMISMFLGIFGISQSLWLLFGFPSLQRRIGTGGVMRLTAYAWPFFFAYGPIANLMLRKHMTATFWTLSIAASIIGSGVAMASTGTQLMLNDISPSSSAFGTLNSLALAIGSGIRAFAPVLFSSLYAIGVKSQILNGELVFVVLIAMAVFHAVVVNWIPEKAQGMLQQQTSRPGD